MFAQYLQLGFQHIADLAAYDHILFIVALCAIYRLSEWKKVAILVTAFTIGHSVTLALAALDIIRFPQAWIEFLIPVTIVATAVYNLVAHRDTGESSEGIFNRRLQLNYLFALLFGLIHGMGFSNFFRALLLPGEESELAAQLFAFNIGVELGQLAIVAVILTVSFLVFSILRMRQLHWNWLVSGIAGVMALRMALERVADLGL
jgi:hypothetical protein